jgi:hypothetical protein
MLARQAITVLDHRCWILVDLDGKPYNPTHEGYPHYTSEVDAGNGYASMFRRYNPDDELEEIPLLLPVEQDTACHILTTVCGYVLDEEGDGVSHQDDPQILIDWALGTGMAILDDGRMVCCTDPEACDACAAALAGTAPPVKVILGQLSIDGGEVVTGGELPTPGALSATAAADLTEMADRDR